MTACGEQHPEVASLRCQASTVSSQHEFHYAYASFEAEEETQWRNASYVPVARTKREARSALGALVERHNIHGGTLVEPRPVDAPTIDIGGDHPDTSRAMAEKVLPKTGTQRRMIYDLAISRGEMGVTDDEVEQVLNLLHQSASAARNSLMKDGWLIDTGVRRQTRSRNEAIAWVAVPGG